MKTLTENETVALCDFLSWHSLADEIVCAGVATGLRHAPTRKARESLLRQMREEYSHSTFMVRLVEGYGRSVPESLSELEGPREKILELANRGWVSFLVGFATSIDGIYGYPWSRAVMTAKTRDEKYFRFYDTVLFPQEIGHYNFASGELRRLLASDHDEVLETARAVASDAFPVYLEFIETSLPYLKAVEADTSAVIEKTEMIKNTYWPREYGFAIDDGTATPDADVEYGPGM
jgi:hypothetical protein